MDDNLKTEIIYALSSAAVGLRLAEHAVKNSLLAVGYAALQSNIEMALEKLKKAEANHGN